MSYEYCIVSYTHLLNGRHTNLGGPAQHLAKNLGKKAYCIWQPIPIGKPTWVYALLKIRDIWLVLTRFKKSHTCVAVESINALLGAFLRKLGVFQKVIYWNLDYSPNRGRLWCFLDRLAVKYSDEIWSGMQRCTHKWKEVPIGYWKRKIPKFKRKGIVYIGLLEDMQGVGLLMQYAKKHKRTVVTIIGTGKDQDKYKSLNLPNVKFFGLLSDRKARNIMYRHKYCWAVYHPDNPTIKTTMPTKPITYYSCGLKVLGFKIKAKTWNRIFKEALQ